jgi:hypothetical protein
MALVKAGLQPKGMVKKAEQGMAKAKLAALARV